MTESFVAVIDIGKTNKKIHIYDRELGLVDTCTTIFEPYERDGVRFENTTDLNEWLLDSLGRLASAYDIRVIGTTAHGAGFACVDETGELTVPVVDYTFEPGESFHDEFYRVAGDRMELQRSTATLELKALVNPGKGIYFVQTRFPDEFAATRHILMYDQYFPMKLCGEYNADPTYLACHTYLFDHTALAYSPVVDKLGIRNLMPERIKDPGAPAGLIRPDIAARTGISPLARVLVGIHDSNASLVPYIIQKQDEDFIVNSTGTWCVAMHPARDVRFSDDEIGKAVFYNMSAFRDPVKTTILLGGLEFESYTDLLKRKSRLLHYPDFDAEVYRDVVAAAREFILPAIVAGTGQFPKSRPRVVEGEREIEWQDLKRGEATPRFFRDPARAYAVLNLSLALQTVTALRRVGLSEGVNVYTEGGFRNNRDYNALLAALCPSARFYLSGMPEATSFGTALLAWAAMEEVPVQDFRDRFSIDQEPVEPADIPGLDRYAEMFYAHLE